MKKILRESDTHSFLMSLFLFHFLAADLKRKKFRNLKEREDKQWEGLAKQKALSYFNSGEWQDAGLEEAQAGIKTAGRNINNLKYADDTTLMAESEEELKSLLMKMKEESEKVALKLNIQKTKIMASGPITSWEIDGKQWKYWQTLFSWAPKSLQMVTAAMKLK